MIHGRRIVFRSLQSTAGVLAPDTDLEEAAPGLVVLEFSHRELGDTDEVHLRAHDGPAAQLPRRDHGSRGVASRYRSLRTVDRPSAGAVFTDPSACGPRTVWADLTGRDSSCGKRLSRSSYGLLLPRPRGALRAPTAATGFGLPEWVPLTRGLDATSACLGSLP